MPESLIFIAQLNPTVADIEGNTQLVIQTLKKIRKHYPHTLVVFPEMMISGYCPQDFLLRPDFLDSCEQAVLTIAKETKNLTVILGSPYPSNASTNTKQKLEVINSAIVYENGQLKQIYAKKQLPNYGVFDEKRYFIEGKEIKGREEAIIHYNNQSIGLLICEDGWQENGYQHLTNKNLDLIISINASPYEQNKPEEREKIATHIHCVTQTPLLYVNLVGGQDELIFDGGSFAISKQSINLSLPKFESAVFLLNFEQKSQNFLLKNTLAIPHKHANERLLQLNHSSSSLDATAIKSQELYHALQLGLRDYILKNRFSKVLLGLSGGIDSALTCTIAVDALGANNVISVMLASPHTSQLSIDLAQEQAELLGTQHYTLNLLDTINSVEQTLLSVWENLPEQGAISRQNIQARLRGLLLMALSNEYNALLLSTGNKSELAVGYATLYGDMAGGFSPIKDIYKTQVYTLSHYRNLLSQAIPKAVIERPPTAELAPNQHDTDSLPEYYILDAILIKFIEEKLSAEQISQQGYAQETVNKVINMVLKNQHKRQQGSIGSKVSATSFGRDFRYPNTQRWQ